MRQVNKTNDYYSDYVQDDNSSKKTESSSTKKIMIAFLLIFVIIIIIILAINLLSQENNRLFFFADGKTFNQNITISKDGKLIDSLSLEGENLVINANPLETIKGKITSTSIKGTKKVEK